MYVLVCSVVEPEQPFLAEDVKKERLQLYSSSSGSDPMFKEMK